MEKKKYRHKRAVPKLTSKRDDRINILFVVVIDDCPFYTVGWPSSCSTANRKILLESCISVWIERGWAKLEGLVWRGRRWSGGMQSVSS